MDYNDQARYYTNKVMDHLEEMEELSDTVISLLKYMSDDDVRDWAELNEIMNFDEEEEEFDSELDDWPNPEELD